jgi:beta-glucosidase/6-phospho-beta-glucosidase/beta-galactosidase
MVSTGLNGYRFSIEMARVYPTREAFDADEPDEDGLAKYRDLLDALRGAKITPLVTLHHFAWPLYMDDPSKNTEPQGWERDDATSVFGAFCERMAREFGGEVDLWVTINEPLVEASVGYLAALWPPGVSDPERLATVMRKQVEGHARCYDKIHAADDGDADGDGKKARVSIADHHRVYEPLDPKSEADAAAVKHAKAFWNLWYLNAIVKGDLDENFDDEIGPGEPKGDPDLAGRADYLGINYYGVSEVYSKGLELPYVGVQPGQFDLQDGRPKNDLGWSIHAAGFGEVLDAAAEYGLPIVVTENGIADAKDKNRSRFLLEHVFEMGKAMKRGAKVEGYFHWALMDNFEWVSGYCPRFGLFAVDLDDAARPRKATKAVEVFRTITKDNKVTQAAIDEQPEYESKPTSCATF